jgi:uroporphyrinogen-III synthase
MIYLLNNDKFEGVYNLPVIKIEFLSPKIELNGVDYLLFTSKNGVRAVDRLTDEWKKLDVIAIGKGTASEVEKRGGVVKYVATKSYGDELAKEIISNFQPATILFPRAKKIVSNIGTILRGANFNLIEKIVYQTTCNKIEKVPEKGVFIFTSPSSVKCFLKQVQWKDSYKAVAIGKRSAEVFPYEIVISDEQSIKKCIKIAKNLL